MNKMMNKLNELDARRDNLYANCSSLTVEQIEAELKALDEERAAIEATWHELDDIEVGDGVTHTIWTDRKAATVIARTAKSITIQYDKATLLNGAHSDAPDRLKVYPGGFAAHVEGRQRYEYERDHEARTAKFTRREIRDRETNELKRIIYKLVGSNTRSAGNTLQAGRHHHYDYNF